MALPEPHKITVKFRHHVAPDGRIVQCEIQQDEQTILITAAQARTLASEITRKFGTA
jgi:2-polyprenyl-3-methyl-5-hydroxy-6-metoxy-1,4-benzoquinol methylase